MTILIIAIGLLAYYTMRQYQPTILVLLNLYAVYLATGWYVMLFLGLTGIISLFHSLLTKNHSKFFVALPIALLIGCFGTLRSHLDGWVLPVGFSVFSFSAISLLVDTYKERKRRNFISVANYLLFFPKIFAGPVEKSSFFLNQDVSKKFHTIDFYCGIKLLIFATFLKFFLADYLLNSTEEAQGFNLFCQILIFALKFFFDFWAYSLMAVGLSEMLGIKLHLNFDKPYYSLSFKEFWRRWNITLGTWLRDYIYIPLGGNQNRGWKWCLTIFITFLISGLWHGSTWPFILWGLFHAGLLCVEKLFVKPGKLTTLPKYLYGGIVTITASFLWQLFLVDSLYDFIELFPRLAQSSAIVPSNVIGLLIGIISLIIFTSDGIHQIIFQRTATRKRTVVEVSLLSIMLLLLVIFNCPISFNFFYFRF